MLKDVLEDAEIVDGITHLPFDLEEVIDNHRRERYSKVAGGKGGIIAKIGTKMYYFVRPLLPVSIRRHSQKWRLKGWEQLAFPQWPVDRSVDDVLGRVLLLSLRAQERESIPFIWFWPEGAPSSAIMTHDVETTVGRELCAALMDINDSYGIKASFQVIPEERYDVTPEFLQSIRERGFEVVVHDLNHDGLLYKNKKQFVRMCESITHMAGSSELTGSVQVFFIGTNPGLTRSSFPTICQFPMWRTWTHNEVAAAP